MIEPPEARVLFRQLLKELKGKEIKSVVAAQNPYKFAWYSGELPNYDKLLSKKKITGSQSYGGQVELLAKDIAVVFSDGVNHQYHPGSDSLLKKHQLLIEFGEETFLSKNIIGNPNKRCGAQLVKDAYPGGSIYCCTGCQKL